MADLNQCTSRTLTSKSCISSELAGRIVNFRKQRGRIKSFSELWFVDGMTRAVMKTLSSKFVIADLSSSRQVNMNNNSNRKSNKKCKPKNKIKAKRNSGINKSFAEMNTRFLESLPLLSESNKVDDNNNLLTVYTPMAVQASPSRRQIITVYQMASPDKFKSQKVVKGSLNKRKYHAKQQTVSKPANEQTMTLKTPPLRNFQDNGLTSSKEKSIKKWLKNTSAGCSNDISTRIAKQNRSNSRNKSRNRHYRRQSISRSRRGSRSPLLRNPSEGREEIRQIKPKHLHSSVKKTTKDITNKSPTHREFADGPLALLDLETSNDNASGDQYSQGSRRYAQDKKSLSRYFGSDNFVRDREERNQPFPLHPSSSSVKQKVEIAESSKDLKGRKITRRSLWKDKRYLSADEHNHHHCLCRRSKSRDRYRSHDRKHSHEDSITKNENCIIL